MTDPKILISVVVCAKICCCIGFHVGICGSEVKGVMGRVKCVLLGGGLLLCFALSLRNSEKKKV